MTVVRLLIVTMALLVAISLSKQFSFSKPADAKKTGKSCLFCHTKYGSKELTKAGKYYKEKGTLDGFEEKSEKAELFSIPELTTRPAALRRPPGSLESKVSDKNTKRSERS